MDKFSTNLTINDKSVDGMLGSQTRGGRMEGADESTELWVLPNQSILTSDFQIPIKARSHWHFLSMFSSGVFAIDINYI